MGVINAKLNYFSPVSISLFCLLAVSCAVSPLSQRSISSFSEGCEAIFGEREFEYVDPAQDLRAKVENLKGEIQSLNSQSPKVVEILGEISDGGGRHLGVYRVRADDGKVYALKLSLVLKKFESPEVTLRGTLFQSELSKDGVASPVLGILKRSELQPWYSEFGKHGKSFIRGWANSRNNDVIGILMAEIKMAKNPNRIDVETMLSLRWTRATFLSGMERIRIALKRRKLGVGPDFPQLLVDKQGVPYLVDFDFARMYSESNRDANEKAIDVQIDETIDRVTKVMDERDRIRGNVHWFEFDSPSTSFKFPVFDETKESASIRAEEMKRQFAQLTNSELIRTKLKLVGSPLNLRHFRVILRYRMDGRPGQAFTQEIEVYTNSSDSADLLAKRQLHQESLNWMFALKLSTLKAMEISEIDTP